MLIEMKIESDTILQVFRIFPKLLKIFNFDTNKFRFDKLATRKSEKKKDTKFVIF